MDRFNLAGVRALNAPGAALLLAIVAVSCGSTPDTVSPAAPCALVLAPVSQTIGVEGGSGTLSVTASPGIRATECSWEAASEDPFVTIDSGASGTGNGTISYTVAGNTGKARTGHVTVSGLTFAVDQTGCEVTASPLAAGFSYEFSQTFNITVKASGFGCQWTARSNVPWIKLVSAGSGTGNGTVIFRMDLGPTCIRVGTLTVGDSTVNITQSGVGPLGPPAVPCPD